MRVAYDGIVFDIVTVHEARKEAMYTEDKTTFLYWHHSIHVSCIVNVDATAATNFPVLFDLVRNQNPDEVMAAPAQKKAWKPAGPDQIPIKEQSPEDAQGNAARSNRERSRVNEEYERLFPGLGGGRPRPLEPGETQEQRDASEAQRIAEQRARLSRDLKQEFDRQQKYRDEQNPFLRKSPGGLKRTDEDFAQARRAQEEADRNRPQPPPDIGAFGDPQDRNKAADQGAGVFQAALRAARKAHRLVPQPALRGTVPTTMLELRDRLKMPRRQLAVWMHTGPAGLAEFSLVSPLLAEAGTDALHGPLCTVMNETDIVGQQTAVLELMFETWEAPPIRWSREKVEKVRTLGDKKRLEIEQAAIKAAREAYIKAITTKAAGRLQSAEEQGFIGIAEDLLRAAKEAVDSLTTNKNIEKAVEASREIPGGRYEIEDDIIRAAVREALKALGPALKPPEKEKDVFKKVIDTPAMLSNRWTMSFGWDPETYLRHQIIEGQALFRMDVLKLKKLTADQMRAFIYHPIPNGYRRMPVGDDDVKISSGGEEITYRIVDHEVLLNMPGAASKGIIHVEVEENFDHSGYTINVGDGGAAGMGQMGAVGTI